MDLSGNRFDLMYLVNPNLMNKLQHKNNTENTALFKNDIKFYRKRIFALTRDYLRGKKRDNDLDKIWENYAQSCIEYFKFIDKSEIIQNTYKDIKVKKNTTPIDLKAVDKGNEFIMNKKK